jgi:hypothetical protein
MNQEEAHILMLDLAKRISNDLPHSAWKPIDQYNCVVVQADEVIYVLALQETSAYNWVVFADPQDIDMMFVHLSPTEYIEV